MEEGGRMNPIIPAAQRHGLSRQEAAEYVGVSATLFDQMVADRRMPRAKRINSRRVWPRLSLEKAFAHLPDEGDDKEDAANEWDDCE
jgi:predicted DNA-binding transcriptional regulator AlpA